jgi:hypothetical protein
MALSQARLRSSNRASHLAQADSIPAKHCRLVPRHRQTPTRIFLSLSFSPSFLPPILSPLPSAKPPPLPSPILDGGLPPLLLSRAPSTPSPSSMAARTRPQAAAVVSCRRRWRFHAGGDDCDFTQAAPCSCSCSVLDGGG